MPAPYKEFYIQWPMLHSPLGSLDFSSPHLGKQCTHTPQSQCLWPETHLQEVPFNNLPAALGLTHFVFHINRSAGPLLSNSIPVNPENRD